MSQKRKDKVENFDSHNYDRWNYQNRYRSNSGDRTIQFSKVEVDQGMNKTTGEEILDAMQGHIKILEDRTVEENIKVTIGMKITAEREVGVGLEKDHFQEIIIIEGTLEV